MLTIITIGRRRVIITWGCQHMDFELVYSYYIIDVRIKWLLFAIVIVVISILLLLLIIIILLIILIVYNIIV
eukprot:UN09494